MIKDSHSFSMTLTIDTYAEKIDISVRYHDNTIFTGEFDHVLEIRKSEDVLLVETEYKKPCAFFNFYKTFTKSYRF